MVAEAGGRGGFSTLSGPDGYFYDGRLDDLDGACCVYGDEAVYYSGALDGWLLWPMIVAMRRLRSAKLATPSAG